VVAWIALAVSLASLGVVVWDNFFRKSRLEVKGDWILGEEPPVLRVVVYNVGYRKDSIRDMRFKNRAMPSGRGWTPYASVLQHLPVVLDVDEASPAFVVHPQRKPFNPLDAALLSSDIDAIEVENARGQVSVHELPLLYQAQQNALTNAGPELPKTTS
jgi:hypothetical protein